MGAFPNTLLLLQLNMEEPTQDIIINGSILKKSSMEEEQKNNKSCRRRRRTSKSLAKKTRRSSTRIVQRVTTLRNLVPNMNNDNDNDNNDGSLEQLFTHTADYILSLQTRVRFMRTLVDVLSGSSSRI
ncbi:Transcription factor UPBEAT1, partial [Cucurbita argyrosperma subsp. sororia]